MNKLIRADELEEWLQAKIRECNFLGAFGERATAHQILQYVKHMPAVDAAPVVHGRWIIDTAFGNDVMSNGRMVLCSECGQGRFTGKTNYCPNCGAKMDRLPGREAQTHAETPEAVE